MTRMRKSSQQWTDEQPAWLTKEAKRLGLTSIGAVARMVVQAEMDRRTANVGREGEAA